MLTYEKQALSGAIEVLSRSELPDKFEGMKLYGSSEEAKDELRQDCKIFRLSNETGYGRVAVYQVFPGIELYYNDMHMGYCNQNQATVKNMIEINHCLIGRFECSFGENSCCYMTEGDLSISSMMKKKSNSCFPLNHYHGISIIINLDELLPKVRRIMELLNIDLNYIQKYICELLLNGKGSTQEQRDNLLKLYGLFEWKERHPATLSGGQKQRLTLAVSDWIDTPILILDEPTSGLDFKNMMRISEHLKALAQKGKTILIITHDYEFAAMTCNRVLHFVDEGHTEIFPLKGNLSRLYSCLMCQ